MILLTTYYKSINEDRNIEINKCLYKNLNNKFIEKIYLLNNEIFDLGFINDIYNKIIQVIVSKDNSYRLKYKDAIKFINENLKNKICILSNSDIYFDDSISKINNKTIHNKFFALLRYDEDLNGNKHIFELHNNPRNDSQDSWIFRSPLNIDLDNLDFSFGILGCDSIFASLVYETGINISNPCYDIITTHLHNIDFRTYNCDNRIHGKYCLLPPCKIDEYKNPEFINY